MACTNSLNVLGPAANTPPIPAKAERRPCAGGTAGWSSGARRPIVWRRHRGSSHVAGCVGGHTSSIDSTRDGGACGVNSTLTQATPVANTASSTAWSLTQKRPDRAEMRTELLAPNPLELPSACAVRRRTAQPARVPADPAQTREHGRKVVERKPQSFPGSMGPIAKAPTGSVECRHNVVEGSALNEKGITSPKERAVEIHVAG